jgi:hypothetical protein
MTTPIARSALTLTLALACGLLAAHHAAAQHDEHAFGPRLPLVADLHVGPTMYLARSGPMLYAIGRSELRILDASDAAHPKLISRLPGLGNVRQIAVRDGLAYITAREDGLFIVDVKDPASPRLLTHYDTIELATGICLSGPLAFVACRNYGVELIDITHPASPRHLSTVRTGEAQSVIARDGILYVGVWGTRELVIVDVHNPAEPRIISTTKLDGYGDGVDLHGNLCFVALATTPPHSPHRTPPAHPVSARATASRSSTSPTPLTPSWSPASKPRRSTASAATCGRSPSPIATPSLPTRTTASSSLTSPTPPPRGSSLIIRCPNHPANPTPPSSAA